MYGRRGEFFAAHTRGIMASGFTPTTKNQEPDEPRTKNQELIMLILLICGCATSSWSQSLPLAPEEPAAGRTMAQWREQLSDPNAIVRLRAAKTLGVYGAAAAPSLTQALDDEHPGVAYWACYHLGYIQNLHDQPLIAKLKQLRERSGNPAVQMAADYALCRQEGLATHLQRLADKLTFPERGMACSAAEMLGRLGPEAKDALPALRAAFEKHNQGKGPGVDYHIRGAVQNALRLIQSADPLPQSKDDR